MIGAGFPFGGESFPYTNFHDLNMDWILQVVKDFKEKYPEIVEGLAGKVNKPVDDPDGSEGQILTSLGNGNTKWMDSEGAIEQYVIEAVNAWLDDHPEATTTVQDGSLTVQKFTDALKLATVKEYGTPEMFGAAGDGETDDSAAIQDALDNYGTVVLSQKYLVSNALSVNSGNSVLFLGGSQIIVSVDQNTPLFFMNKATNVEFIGFGGGNPNITGNCGVVFAIAGENNFEASPANYSRFIRIKDLWISEDENGDGIDLGVYLGTAVRQLVIDGCTIYCHNGIYAHGKTVENTVVNSIVWGTASAGYAIKIDSDLGTTLYNEGWTISNCTLDTTDKTYGLSLDLADFWVIQLSNNYIGTNIAIKSPTSTTHSEDIQFSNCVMYGRLSTTGQTSFHLKVSSCTVIGKGFTFNNNGRFIDISDVTFKGGNSESIAITILAGVSHVDIHDIRIDENYGNGIIINGENGTPISIHDVLYEGNGTDIYSARPFLAHNNSRPNFTRSTISHATVAEGGTIGTCSRGMQKGANFLVTIKTTLKGADDSGQTLLLSITNGEGGCYIPFYSENQFIGMTVACKVTTTGTVIATLTNYDGNSVTTDYHDFIEIVEL